MKRYEKPMGKIKNLRAMLDEVIAMKEKSKRLQPALAIGDDDYMPMANRRSISHDLQNLNIHDVIQTQKKMCVYVQ